MYIPKAVDGGPFGSSGSSAMMARLVPIVQAGESPSTSLPRSGIVSAFRPPRRSRES